MRSSRLLCLSSILFIAAPAWCDKQPIVQTDLLKIGRVTEVAITRDGALAVYAVQTIHTDPASTPGGDPVYSYRVNLWMADLRDPSSRPAQLTFGARHDGSIAISPDGRQLAFVRVDDEPPAAGSAQGDNKKKPHPQIWILPLRGAGEPHVVTHLEFGATAPHWREDGKALLVSSEVPISKLPGKPTFDIERPGREWWDFDRPAAKDAKPQTGSPDGDLRSIRDWLEHNAAENDPVDITRLAFLGELSLNDEMTFSELFRIDLDTQKATQLTSTYRDHDGAAFSPNGDRILFSAEPASHLHPDRIEERSNVWQMGVDGLDEHSIMGDEQYSFFAPQFTKDGKHLVVVGRQTDDPAYRQTRLAIANPDGSHVEWLTPDGDSSAQNPRIADDGGIYYTVEYQGGEPLRRVSMETRHVDDVIAGPVGVNAFATGGGKVVYAQISAQNPNELYVMADGLRKGADPARRRLTDINAAWLEEKSISLPEEHWITRPDGTRVQYWVMKPLPNRALEPGKKYPWVLDMHGGPSAMWGPGEFTMWHEFQIFCAFGYGVVYSNPRGSGGYGYAFERANFKNWGEAPMGDVMGALDDAIAKYPMIDADRLFVTGGSYAGYLTAWIVGHTDRFKAAAALRGVYDLSTFFGEGNAYRLVPNEFGGYPWEPQTRRLLDEESPITYVENIHTPLLIIHGSQDNRTGVVQGQMLFRALKQMNRPVEYVRYPGIGHEITRSGPPNQRMDHMLRIIEFFERYSGNAAPPPTLSAGAKATSAQ